MSHAEMLSGFKPVTGTEMPQPLTGRTLGELVDRLTILNLKLWFVQDAVHKASQHGEGLDAETTKKLADLNLDRNKTMTQIDLLLDHAIRDGRAEVDPRIKVL